MVGVTSSPGVTTGVGEKAWLTFNEVGEVVAVVTSTCVTVLDGEVLVIGTVGLTAVQGSGVRGDRGLIRRERRLVVVASSEAAQVLTIAGRNDRASSWTSRDDDGRAVAEDAQ